MLAQTATAIESTGGAAGTSVEHVEGLSTSLMKLSGTDDEVITKGQDLLLSFTDVQNRLGQGNDVFDRATKAGLDLATRGFGSVEGNARLLGIALEDPEKGLTRLRRAGIVLTEQQTDSIKGFAATGDLLNEQKVLLDAVEGKVGGAAKAYGETLPGQLAIANESMKNAKAAVVAGAAPAMELMASVTTSAADAIMGLPKPLQDVVGGIGLLVFAAAGIARPLQAGIQIFQLLTASRGEDAVAAGAQATATEAATVAESEAIVASLGLAGANEAVAVSAGEAAAGEAAVEAASIGVVGVLGLAVVGAGVAYGVYSALSDVWTQNAKSAGEYTKALESNSGALQKNVDEVTAHAAETSGAADLARTAGISFESMFSAVREGGENWAAAQRDLGQYATETEKVPAINNRVAQSLRDAGIGQSEFGRELIAGVESGKISGQQVNALAHEMEGLRNGYVDATGEADKHKEVTDAVTTSNSHATESVDQLRTHTDDLTDSEKALVKQADAASKAHDDFGSFINDLASAMDKSYKGTLSAATAEDAYASSINSLEDSLKKNGTTLDVVADKTGRYSEKALANQKAVRDTGGAIASLIELRFQETHSVDDAVQSGQLYVDNLTEQLQAAGYNTDQIAEMIRVMHLTPEDIKTEFSNNALEQQIVVDKYIKELDEIKPEYRSQIEAEINRGLLDQANADLDAAAHGRVVDFTVNVHGGGQLTMTNRATGEVTVEADLAARNVAQKARGGPVGPGEVFRAAEEGYELLVHDGLYQAGPRGGYVLPNDLTTALARFGAAGPSSSSSDFGVRDVVFHVDARGASRADAEDLGATLGRAFIDTVTPMAARRLQARVQVSG